MEHLVYQPPKAKRVSLYAFLFGLGATGVIFMAIPLSQVLQKVTLPEESGTEAAAINTPPPPPEDVPPPEPEPEDEEPPEPPEFQDDPLDLQLDLPPISMGEAGGFLIDSKYNFKISKEDLDLSGLFDTSQLDGAPQPIQRANPRYPPALSKQKIPGEVLVYMIVDVDGRVSMAEARRSSDPRFESAALEAVKSWKFKPGMKSGKPVRTKVLQLIKFSTR